MGFLIPKADVTSQMEQGEELCVPDLEDPEDSKILRSASTGEEEVRPSPNPSLEFSQTSSISML